MLTPKRSGWLLVIVGSAAIGMVAAGGIVLVEQLVYWARERQWETVTLRSFFLDERGNTAIPFFSRTLVRAGPFVHEFVVQVLGHVPLWAFLVLVGALIAVKVSRVRQ